MVYNSILESSIFVCDGSKSEYETSEFGINVFPGENIYGKVFLEPAEILGHADFDNVLEKSLDAIQAFLVATKSLFRDALLKELFTFESESLKSVR